MRDKEKRDFMKREAFGRSGVLLDFHTNLY